MKKNIILLSIFYCLFNANAARFQVSQETENARVYGADTKICFKVIDDENLPISNVYIGASFYMNKEYGKNPPKDGLTDGDGICTLRETSVGEVTYSAKKKGYYNTRGTIRISGTLVNPCEVKDGKWQPYGRVETIMLRKIINPISLVSYVYSREDLPSGNIGFDIKEGDFVNPYGTGKEADCLFEFERNPGKGNFDYWMKLKLTFTNCVDGAYRARKILNSKRTYCQFQSEYNANTNAVYAREYEFKVEIQDGRKVIDTILNEDEYLVLRTRTKVDKNGNIIRAMYSKIEGPLWLEYIGIRFNAFVNPELNDTNLEQNSYIKQRKY